MKKIRLICCHRVRWSMPGNCMKPRKTTTTKNSSAKSQTNSIVWMIQRKWTKKWVSILFWFWFILCFSYQTKFATLHICEVFNIALESHTLRIYRHRNQGRQHLFFALWSNQKFLGKRRGWTNLKFNQKFWGSQPFKFENYCVLDEFI